MDSLLPKSKVCIVSKAKIPGCGKEKLLEEFQKSKKGKHGRGSKCKACIAEYKNQYYKDNREKIAERKKQYEQDNKEKTSERKKQWRQDNKEKIAEYEKQYREANKEKIAKWLDMGLIKSYGIEDLLP